MSSPWYVIFDLVSVFFSITIKKEKKEMICIHFEQAIIYIYSFPLVYVNSSSLCHVQSEENWSG